MLIRNNDGEIAGEMNVSITQEGTVIRTNTMYQNGRPDHSKHFHPRHSGGRSHDEYIGGKILP